MAKRELIFKLRLSEEEAKKIFATQKKTHLSKSEYCRRILMDRADTILSKENLAVRDDIRNQMRWISANVNQIAKALNGIVGNDKPFIFTPVQIEMIEALTAIIGNWATAKRRIL